MALWELDEFQAPNFLGFVRSVPPPNEFIGTRWLPNRTVTDPEFSYVLGAYRRPVMATIMGYDSETPLHSRAGQGAAISGEMPLIKRKKRIGEKELQRFLTPRQGLPDQQEAVDSVYIQTVDLLDAIQARAEWIRMQGLSEDKILYDEDGVIMAYDYGLDDDLQITLGTSAATDGDGTTLPSAFGIKFTDTENSNPVTTLAAICDRAQKKTGRRPAEWVVSQDVLPLLSGNKAMREMIRGANAPSALLTQPEIDVLFSLYRLPQITTYDVTVQSEQEDGSLVDVRMMAADKSFLVPPGLTVGETLWGPTAEARVLYGTPLAGQAPGIFAEVYGTTDPPAEWTKAAAAAWPTMPQANQLVQLQMFPAGENT